MPRTPKYCHHKATGQAYVTINGRERYLGKFDSPASREEYDRVIIEWRRANDVAGKHTLTTVTQWSIVMRSRLANHFRSVRKERDLSLSQLARLVGYQNVTRGCNRIQKFEERGEIHADLLWKLADSLGIDAATIDALIEQDRREFVRVWNEWADVPISPFIVIRLLPAVHKRSDLPDRIETVEEAEIIAADAARHWRKKVYLQWTRRLSVRFDEDGEITGRTESVPGKASVPTMRLRGSRRSFVLENPATGRTVLRLIGWPEHPISIQE